MFFRVPTFLLHDPTATQLYTLSLHDALPISPPATRSNDASPLSPTPAPSSFSPETTSSGPPTATATNSIQPRCPRASEPRSEEHTSELQSRPHLVCRLLLEKKKNSVIRGTGA